MQLGNKHARVTVMGLGLFGGGLGVARFWAELGSQVTVTDLKSESDLLPSVRELESFGCRMVLGEHREEDFINCDVLVVNPAVKPDNHFLKLAIKHGASVTTEIGTVLRLVHGPVLAVTGSNGKSTTASLLGNIITSADSDTLVGGNMGGSLLPLIKTQRPGAPVVLELSSFQLHYLREQKFAPNAAVVTNLSPNHLDWHRDLDDYYDSKRNILRFQWPENLAVLNAADPVLRDWAEKCRQRVVLFSIDDPDWPNAAFVRDGWIVSRLAGKEEKIIELSEIHLRGKHNIENILAAVAAAHVHVKDPAIMRYGIATFRALPHRLEEVGCVDGVTFYNDSIATTPESVIAALHSFTEPMVLIAGGYDKGVSFDELGREIAENAAGVVLIGNTAGKIAEAVTAAGGKNKIRNSDTLEDAVRLAKEICPQGGAVVLSPACASYDMFKNFRDRGEKFKAAVASL